MATWKRHIAVLAMVLVVMVMGSIGLAQINITLPGGLKPQGYTGKAINFGAVQLEQTKTVQYTFKILETSETSEMSG